MSLTFLSYGQSERWISLENESYYLEYPDSWIYCKDSTGFVEFWLYDKSDPDTCKVHVCLNIDDFSSSGKKANKYFKTNKATKEEVFDNYEELYFEKTKTKSQNMRLYKHIFKYINSLI